MNIQRISKIIAIAAFVLAGLILCGQDTMSYGYYRYMFNPQQYASEPDYSSSIPHYCYAFCKDHATLYTKVHEFVPKDEVLVYGIAMSMYHDVDIEALLYVKHGDTMVFVDAAPWTSQTSQQQHYFKFDSLCLSPFASICDSIHYETPLYEFYFDRPHLMSDTFYVGYHNIPFPGLEWNGGRTYITRSERPCDSPLGNYIVVFRDMHINCTSWQRGQESRFGGVYPIIIPPCDSTFDPCLPVENFSHEVLSPNQVSFSWDTVGDQTDFQISFGPYDMPPDSNLWHTTMSNPEVYSGCWDEKTYYAAYIRASATNAATTLTPHFTAHGATPSISTQAVLCPTPATPPSQQRILRPTTSPSRPILPATPSALPCRHCPMATAERLSLLAMAAARRCTASRPTTPRPLLTYRPSPQACTSSPSSLP